MVISRVIFLINNWWQTWRVNMTYDTTMWETLSFRDIGIRQKQSINSTHTLLEYLSIQIVLMVFYENSFKFSRKLVSKGRLKEITDNHFVLADSCGSWESDKWPNLVRQMPSKKNSEERYFRPTSQGSGNGVTDRCKQEWIWCCNSTVKANPLLQRIRIWNVSAPQ